MIYRMYDQTFSHPVDHVNLVAVNSKSGQKALQPVYCSKSGKGLHSFGLKIPLGPPLQIGKPKGENIPFKIVILMQIRIQGVGE